MPKGVNPRTGGGGDIREIRDADLIKSDLRPLETFKK